ncbi:MAG: DUF1080 domain-containing protein [Lentisphaeraceae bacterium]|nr:DUF1080 domain-containing protein [Lentisphaeraceae bacterium]
MKLSFIFSLLFAVSSFSQSSGKRACMLIGERTYSSSQTMPQLAVHLEDELQMKVDYIVVPKNGNINNLDILKKADILILYLERRNIPNNQLKEINNWLKQGKPAIAFKLSNQAFMQDPMWFHKYFGGSFQGVSPELETTISVLPESDNHPIVSPLDVKSFTSQSPLIFPGQLKSDTTVLLMGKTEKSPAVPIAWTRTTKTKQRFFYTSLGTPEDFQSYNFMALIDNAINWCLNPKLKHRTKKQSDVPDTPPLVLPVGARALFNGVNLDNWRSYSIPLEKAPVNNEFFYNPREHKAKWIVQNETITPQFNQEDIITKEAFGNYQLHLDFYIPEEPDYVPDEMRGAGGVFISGRYEVQILANSKRKDNTSGGSINGLRAPDHSDSIQVGQWNSMDIFYSQKEGEPVNMSVVINGTQTHGNIKFAKSSPYGLTETMATNNAADRSMHAVSIENSQKILNLGLKPFSVLTRFKTKEANSTLFAKTSPTSGWEPDGKAFFLLNGELIYDIGWKGVVNTGRFLNDDQWHQALLTSDGDMTTMYIDGKLCFMKKFFQSADPTHHAVKVGYSRKNFYRPFNGDISNFSYFDKALTEADAKALSANKPIDIKPAYAWSPKQNPIVKKSNTPTNKEFIKGPIQLQRDFSKIRYANIWIKEN